MDNLSALVAVVEKQSPLPDSPPSSPESKTGGEFANSLSTSSDAKNSDHHAHKGREGTKDKKSDRVKKKSYNKRRRKEKWITGIQLGPSTFPCKKWR